MKIQINDILTVGTDTKFLMAIAHVLWTVPIFSDKDWVIEHISDTLWIITSSYMFHLEKKLDGYLYDPWYFPRKNGIYRLFPCWLSHSQEYCTSYIELIEEVDSHQIEGIYTVADISKEKEMDIDRQSYIIGTIVENMPVLLPPNRQYFSSYYYNSAIQYTIRNNTNQLKIWDIYIPVWEKNIKLWKKYKYSCKYFMDEWFYPEFTWCLELDWLITREDITIDELKSHGIKE